MVDISSQNNKINVTVSSSGNTANVNATPDSARYYSDKSKEWAISNKIVDNTDYSSKYYANESKKQADISIAKTTEVVESGNNAVSNIESARDNAITDITNQESLSVDNVNTAGTTQINLAKEQVALATNQANIATEQATIATSQASIATSKTTEVVKSGNTALSNIETAKNNALNDINTTGAEYVNNAKQYAQNALTSANNASVSETNALSYKKSALESSQIATEQANIAITNANKAATSATNAKTSETNAKSSETRCEEILSRLGTAIKIKGRVDSIGDLPLGDNLDGDAYLIGEEGLDSYPEYYWYQDHWEFLGTTGTSLSWGLISGDISNQTDLQTALNNKQDVIADLATIREGAAKGATAIQNTNDCVHLTGSETVTGTKTFTGNPVFQGNDYTNILTVKRNDAYGSFIKFDNSSGTKGFIGIASNGNPNYANPSGTAYNLVRNSALNTAVGSTTKPVYINSNGVATAITSYEGNSATATKSTRDGDGNVITSTYLKKTEGYHPPLLSTVWSDHLLNDMSWLRADTFSWQSGTTYSLTYNELLSEYNNSASVEETEGSITFKRTPKGYKIALATQETAIDTKYTTDGIAWYYILDTGNKKFKLPRGKYNQYCQSLAVKGNGMSLGLTNGTTNYGLVADNGSYGLGISTQRYGSSLPSDGSGWNKQYGSYGVTTDPTKSGIIASSKADNDFHLYFYVGEFTQTAEAQTAGLKAELLNGKLDVSNIKRYPIEISDKSLMPSWYVVYNDGWCEQGGEHTTRINGSSSVDIILLKAYTSTSFNVGVTGKMSAVATGYYVITGSAVSKNSIRICNDADNSSGLGAYWRTSGYIS